MSTASPPADQSLEKLLSLITGYMRSQAIYVAAKLGIADHLVAGPRTVAELAAETGAHAPSLHRLLRALASEGVFREREAGVFELTPMAELLRSDIPESMRVWAIVFNEEQYRAWGGMLTSVRTGEVAFDHVFGERFFDWLGEHPESSETFNQAMANGDAPVGPALVDGYDFGDAGVIVDVGGGSGRLLSEILAAHPGARGILFDQPHVVEDAATARQLRAVADRCRVMGGDFFAAVPEGGDVYLMKQIIHDWDDARCVTVLRNCRRAMGPGARLLILEVIIAPANAPDVRTWMAWMDLHLLALSGGRERTEAEMRRLLEAAGFAIARVIPLAIGQSVTEAVPAEPATQSKRPPPAGRRQAGGIQRGRGEERPREGGAVPPRRKGLGCWQAGGVVSTSPDGSIIAARDARRVKPVSTSGCHGNAWPNVLFPRGTGHHKHGEHADVTWCDPANRDTES